MDIFDNNRKIVEKIKTGFYYDKKDKVLVYVNKEKSMFGDIKLNIYSSGNENNYHSSYILDNLTKLNFKHIQQNTLTFVNDIKWLIDYDIYQYFQNQMLEEEEYEILECSYQILKTFQNKKL